MAFKRVGNIDGTQDPFEYYLLTNAEGATLGEALVQTAGRLTKCGATVTPEFIAVASRVAEATSITPLPVTRVKEGTEFSTTSSATVAATLIGSKVTIDATGLLATATAASGVFEISATDGANAVNGYFRR